MEAAFQEKPLCKRPLRELSFGSVDDDPLLKRPRRELSFTSEGRPLREISFSSDSDPDSEVPRLPAELLAGCFAMLLWRGGDAEDGRGRDDEDVRGDLKAAGVRSLRAGCSVLAAAAQSCTRWRRDLSRADLWRRAFSRVLWPMRPDTEFIAAQLDALRRSGDSCKHLRVDCLRTRPADLPALVCCCPSVETLELSFFGPEGAGNFAWMSAWRTTLRRLSVSFWYDAALGAPNIAEALIQAGSRCEALEELHLAGLDWPRAKAESRGALKQQQSGSRQLWRSLRVLQLKGSEPWSAADLDELSALSGRGVDIHVYKCEEPVLPGD